MLCFTGGRNKIQIVAKITAEKKANKKSRLFISVKNNNNNNDHCK
jgi:hypothetical protein